MPALPAPSSTTSTSRGPLPWPTPYRAALSITMDNLGEAADIHRGLYPPAAPQATPALGTHHSATTQLPRMLRLLSALGLRATYFVEGWNSTVYPSLLRTEVVGGGHELGFHAWQHEVWKNLDPRTEEGNMRRSLDDTRREVGVGYKGFRPPGGLVTDRTLALMKERGFTYLSPAAERCAVVDGVAMVPFRWKEIDAYYYMDSTKCLRERDLGSGEKIPPKEMGRRLKKRVDEVLAEGGYMALLFHPFLTDDDERHEVMRDVLEYVKSKEKDGLWIAQCRDVADWVLKHEDDFGNDPGWDTAEWKKK